MSKLKILFLLICLSSAGYAASGESAGKSRVVVVDSYHREYLWSQETNQGFSEAMLKFGYFDNQDQLKVFAEKDFLETSKAVVKRMWLDAKRKESKEDQAKSSAKIADEIKAFEPGIILLGDDNAANYVGRRFLDSGIPVVFWGVNHNPVKYGLVDDVNRPGHNVTGVYQTGYFGEGLELLKMISPAVKTFAILSDDSSTGRANFKAMEYLIRKGGQPLEFKETVSTNDYELWKSKALELQKEVDAFFIAMYSTLKDKNGEYVSSETVAAWYLKNIKIPEVTVGSHFVKHGLLCSANDSGYNQGYEAVMIANDILNGADPATYPPRAPKRGPYVVNKQRAKMLGMELTEDMGIEEYIEKASVLQSP